MNEMNKWTNEQDQRNEQNEWMDKMNKLTNERVNE